MLIFRKLIENWYESHRDEIFERTKENPKEAHNNFTIKANLIHHLGLSGILLNNYTNNYYPGFGISNAAGFNKDGLIPPTFLRHLGFDRVVIGTVTGDPWAGNSGQTITRYPNTGSMVNWEGLPGEGAFKIHKRMIAYGQHGVPLTVNFMSTPGKEGLQQLLDLEGTIELMKLVPYVNRFELNISCPNTHNSSGEIDARKQYTSKLDEMLKVTDANIPQFMETWLKVSPDQTRDEIKATIETAMNHRISGFVTTNTTTNHDKDYITSSPNSEGKGGASGNAVYEKARTVQNFFRDEIVSQDLPLKLIAVGGINDRAKAMERTYKKSPIVQGIQIYTPLIFVGPRLLRELRTA